VATGDAHKTLQCGRRDEDAAADLDVRDLAATNRLVCEGPADAERCGGLLDAHGEPLLLAADDPEAAARWLLSRAFASHRIREGFAKRGGVPQPIRRVNEREFGLGQDGLLPRKLPTATRQRQDELSSSLMWLGST
jgi:hypothetical protein